MPMERLAMRHVRDVIRMKAAGMPSREIARRVGAAPSTVRLTIRRFEAAGLTWPLPDDMTDAVLEARLFAGAGSGNRQGHRRQAEPDWAAVHRELKRKHVTLSIVWEEYIAAEPSGYRYSRFCELYRTWEGRLSVTMRQSHAAGDKLFVDYAGDGVPVVIDRLTGERRHAQIFVAVLGASNFTYAQATWTQGLADWISGHAGAFEAIGGVPALLVPDNTKVAVIKACLYDPQINRTYAEMAAHYGTAILPARPRRPRDKAKVEQAVLIVERWLLGRLRHHIFHSLADVNEAISKLLTRLNEERPIRRLGVTRRKLLEEIDRPALKALPASPYVFAEWRIRRVSIDYHIEVEAHYYSVPYRFVRAEVEVRFTARTVEIFHKGERIAAHQRMSGNHKHTTVPEHMASSHRRYAGWTIERIRKDAALVGPATAALCNLILEQRSHPEQGFRACLGIIRLAGSYGRERLEAAATRAIDIGARTYGSVKSILANNLDRHPNNKRSADETPIQHSNIRGPRYYN
jgi:transposase